MKKLAESTSLERFSLQRRFFLGYQTSREDDHFGVVVKVLAYGTEDAQIESSFHQDQTQGNRRTTCPGWSSCSLFNLASSASVTLETCGRALLWSRTPLPPPPSFVPDGPA
ncbi:hypothetical protein TNCV_3972471 [Trichonephila clavipes]|nr:hypothetical protein TNCV_3972471 [Trichonephila clavipes]